MSDGTRGCMGVRGSETWKHLDPALDFRVSRRSIRSRWCRFVEIRCGGCKLGVMGNLELMALVVRDYDPAIRFFVDALQFELVEDTPSLTNDGRPKRWVVVRPVGAKTGILLARADGERQAKVIGQQFAGRVGLFLRVDDFDASFGRMEAAGVQFVSSPRAEPYGMIAVFLDLEGNRWDLLGPRLQT